MTDRQVVTPRTANSEIAVKPASRFGNLPTRDRIGRVSLTWETLAWISLVVTAIITRYWNLGYRTVHHDESLHAYYSWIFSTGEQSYVHNPLMHGPFLFHANALIYKIFGVSDATSRYVPAAFGVGLVWMPWLLRGKAFLGRYGALATSFMLLISPSFLYYTRYIRHDPYTCGGALLLAISIFRYLERPQRRWIIIAFFCVSFLFTNHEIVFAILLGMVVVLWGSLLLTRLRPLIPVHFAAGALAVFALALLRHKKPFPAIPWDNPTKSATDAYYSALFSNPLVIGLIIVGLMFVVAVAATLIWMGRQSDREGSLNDRLFGDAPRNSVAFGVWNALRDPNGLVIGASIALIFGILLFTTFFRNPRGLATATYAPDGTLLYWLGQQGVQRGEQPWFYFITEGFQYEWLGIFFAAAALGVLIWRTFRGIRTDDYGRNYLFNAFNGFWFVFMFAVLSWAGEKMPWLITHFALPAFLLAGAFIDEIVEGALRWRARHLGQASLVDTYGALSLFGGLVFCALAWFFLAARDTYGQWTQTATGMWERQISRGILNGWWHLAIPPVIALSLIAAATWLIGTRRTAYATITAAFIVFSLFQLHQGWRLAFLDGDVAIDTMIYNTTSPDVTDVTSDLEALSQRRDHNLSMQVGYDGCVQWPFNWYLRDMPNAHQMDGTIAVGNNGPEVILAGPAGCGFPDQLEGYTPQTYVLRWHEPEQSVYRNFAIAPEIPPGRSAWISESDPHGLGAIVKSIGSSIMTMTNPQGQQRLWRLMTYREMPDGLITYEFTVFVRNDVLPDYNAIRYGK